jgi:NADP-dependent 3-hydroxy acid dehydrogenase YdfG
LDVPASGRHELPDAKSNFVATQHAQKVLITAGPGGIGRVMSGAFAATGARVHVCDLDAKALD